MAKDVSDFCVCVPATTANLGPGFDAFGMALTVYNEFTVRPAESGLKITIEGEGVTELPCDEENLFVQAFTSVFEAVDTTPPPIILHMQNSIPLFRGLGSSASATVGGLVAANYVMGNALSSERLLQLACEREGHPDNVAAALFGGLIVCAAEGGVLPTYARVPVPRNLHAVVCVPDQHLPTALARKVVPKEVPLSDAVFNIGRAALLLMGIMQADEDLIRIGMNDRLHQPARNRSWRPLWRLEPSALSGARRARATFTPCTLISACPTSIGCCPTE